MTLVSGGGAKVMGGKTLTGTQTYTLVIDPDTSLEEIVDVTVYSSGDTLSITRGIENTGTGFAHSAGAIVRHMVIGRDLQEANDHSEASTAVHGITGSVVGTTDTQTLSAKTLTTPTIASFTNATHDHSNAAGGGTLGSGVITSTMIANDTIVNADINSSAAIAYSKLNLANSITSSDIVDGTIVNADINAAAAIDKTKISGTAITAGDTGTVTSTMITDNTIVNADINSSAQIAYGKLNLTNSIVNADINAAAAIDWTKISPSSTVSTTEIGYLAGVTSAIQTQIDSKLAISTAASTYAPLASPALTGTPTAPTAAANTNTTQIATTAYVQTEITDLIASAPGALDTLNELAAALGNDASFSTTVTNSLAAKLSLSGGTMTGAIAMGTSKITGLGTPTANADAATKNYVDTVIISPSNLTGPITSVGAATSIASQTGTGTKFVVDTSPTLVTPILGVATATSVNGTSIPSNKTLVATDSTQYVVPSQSGNSGKFLTTDGTTSSWDTAVTPAGSQTLTNKTITFGNNTISGTTAQFNTALTDGDFVTLAGSETLTNKTLTSPTINGAFTNSVNEIITRGFEENVNVVASAATGTINFDVATASIWYYTSNATANHTLNFRYNSSTTLSSKLAVGDAITLVWLNTNGSTAYYPNTIQIDGTTVTPKVPAAITAGNASSVDTYSFTIIKTASTPTYTVLETQTKFA